MSNEQELEQAKDAFWQSLAKIREKENSAELDRTTRINLETKQFPFSVTLGSKDRLDSEFHLDSNQKSEYFYSRRDYAPIEFTSENYGLLSASETKRDENIESRVIEIGMRDVRAELLSSDLLSLRSSLIEELSDKRKMMDLKTYSKNDVTATYEFDLLSGEIVGIGAGKIEPSFKEYSTTLRKENMKSSLINQFRNNATKPTDEKINQAITSLEEEYKKNLVNEEDFKDKDDKELHKFIIQTMEISSLSNAKLYLESENVKGVNKHRIKSHHPAAHVKAQLIEEEKNGVELSHWTILDFVTAKNEDAEEADETDPLLIAADTTEKKLDQEEPISKDAENKDGAIVLQTNLASAPTLTKRGQQKAKEAQRGNNEWAVADKTDLSNFYEVLPKNKFAMQYPFELDEFQKRAVLHLERKESVFVAAHTSAGKTVVAEYAIALAQKHMTKAIYTSPVKALSNQKYRDFVHKFGDVGILTGDVSLNANASCLIVTTEVLRSMLYKGSDIIRDIEWVIFDEVHYLNNVERGVVWEETIILLPDHVGIIMLSATVPNALEFANWVGMTKRKIIYVQQTYHRPTPLEHSIFLNGQLHVIKRGEEGFLDKEYKEITRKLMRAREEHKETRDKRNQDRKERFEEKGWKDKDKKKQEFLLKKNLNIAAKEYNAGKKISVQTDNLRYGQNKGGGDIENFIELINHANKHKLLPAVFFTFSKKKCMEIAFGLGSLGLITKNEAGRITQFFDSAIKRLKPVDQELPQLIGLKMMLQEGIAVHHGDLLPIAKEIVEILFTQGLIKVLFATETFAMGINMPAKTVVFTGIKKNDGVEFRYLKSSEYTQMAGRAGRRGIDDKGNVILFIRSIPISFVGELIKTLEIEDLPAALILKGIVDHKGEELESKFRLTYQIIFNLVLSKELKVTDVMKRSYIEAGKTSLIPYNQQKLYQNLKLRKRIENGLSCHLVDGSSEIPIHAFHDDTVKLRGLCKALWHGHLIYQLENVLPRFVMFLTKNMQLCLGILFRVVTETDEVKRFKILHLTGNERRIQVSYETQYKVALFENSGFLANRKPWSLSEIEQEYVLDVINEEIKGPLLKSEPSKDQLSKYAEILDKTKLQVEMLVGDRNKSFLFEYRSKHSTQQESMDPVLHEMSSLIGRIMNSKCFTCEKKTLHLGTRRIIQGLSKEIQAQQEELNDDNLANMGEFEGRMKVLQELNYLDKYNQPLLKARAARELGSSEIFLSEVIMENLLEGLTPAEIAALLSAFVCQIKKTEFDFTDYIPLSLQQAIEKVQDLCESIVSRERKRNVIKDDDEKYLDEKVNFGLSHVVYEWANQKTFAEICHLTDAQEGSIVRTILRLDGLLKNTKNACRLMGNMNLLKLVDEAGQLIRRDIIFASSLYLE